MSESYYRRLIFNQEIALASSVAENERLRDCRGKLKARRASMNSSKPNYSEPELTASTWRGKHADKFEDNRESGVIDTYNSLLDKVDDALDRVDNAINHSQDTLTFQTQNLQNYKAALQRELAKD
ncbi:YwqH-like family protein [Alkalicoccobacillus porphyridii]|uniref:DUF5082 domain-containing protein n=1 Tax=Alkalicoccobacillus porphyridii TaxID=2597270 RepID=A0A553ZV67_9BACI|nr:DUF5082 family protein [Alkalicoccobacillus porphyridii]TSB45225.1 DUF5082 domain-containing protein [Alkalicoccobacillus porphyridii]